MKITSITNLFEITLPDGWSNNFEDGIYTFLCPDTFNGAIQISAFLAPFEYFFDIDAILETEQGRFPNIKRTAIGIYEATIASSIINDNLIQYSWIVGENRARLFVTLTTDNYVEQQIECFEKAKNILSSLKINSIITKMGI